MNNKKINSQDWAAGLVIKAGSVVKYQGGYYLSLNGVNNNVPEGNSNFLYLGESAQDGKFPFKDATNLSTQNVAQWQNKLGVTGGGPGGTGYLRIRGSVANAAALPTTGQVEGDVWNLINTGENVVWVTGLNNTNIAGWDTLTQSVESLSESLLSLSGTLPSKPLSGQVKMSTSTGKFVKTQPVNDNCYSEIYFEDSGAKIFTSGAPVAGAPGTGGASWIHVQGDNGIDMQAVSITPGAVAGRVFLQPNRGLVGGFDYSANPNELDYVQRKYVDAQKKKKEIIGYISQTGTQNPVFVTVHSDISFSGVANALFTRTAAGVSTMDTASFPAFTLDKVFFSTGVGYLINGVNQTETFLVLDKAVSTPTSLVFKNHIDGTNASGGAQTYDEFINVPFKLEIYN
jgi:hypothetical protein